MAAVVVDASVMVALYLDEPLSEKARSAVRRCVLAGDDLHAPDLLLVECANAFWKRVGRGEFEQDAAMTAISQLSMLEDLNRHRLESPILPSALSLAMAHSLTAYDATYAALAVQLGGKVISGDRRFVERASAAGLPVVSIEDGD